MRKAAHERDEVQHTLVVVIGLRDQARMDGEKVQQSIEAIEDANLDKAVAIRNLKDTIETRKTVMVQQEETAQRVEKEIEDLQELIAEQERAFLRDQESETASTDFFVPPVSALRALQLNDGRQSPFSPPLDSAIDALAVRSLPGQISSVEEIAAEEKEELRRRRQESAHNKTMLRRTQSASFEANPIPPRSPMLRRAQSSITSIAQSSRR